VTVTLATVEDARGHWPGLGLACGRGSFGNRRRACRDTSVELPIASATIEVQIAKVVAFKHSNIGQNLTRANFLDRGFRPFAIGRTPTNAMPMDSVQPPSSPNCPQNSWKPAKTTESARRWKAVVVAEAGRLDESLGSVLVVGVDPPLCAVIGLLGDGGRREIVITSQDDLLASPFTAVQ
jgi:hypothetical protein